MKFIDLDIPFQFQIRIWKLWKFLCDFLIWFYCFKLTVEILKINVNKKGKNSKFLVFFVIVYKKIHTYEGSVLGTSPWEKLIFIVSDVMRNLASMRIRFLVRSRCQSSSSALMMFTSSASVENSWFIFWISL